MDPASGNVGEAPVFGEGLGSGFCYYWWVDCRAGDGDLAVGRLGICGGQRNVAFRVLLVSLGGSKLHQSDAFPVGLFCWILVPLPFGFRRGGLIVEFAGR